MKLRDMGFDAWFEARAVGLCPEDCGFARVIAVDRGSCLIRDEAGEVPAELSGALRFRIDSPADLPCVGDWVAVRRYDEGAALIQEVLPRRTFLRRRTPGRNVGFQMIAANVDTAFIVQSCHADFNPGRLDRYLVAAADGGVEAVVVLTKTDLIPPEELERKLAIAGSAARAGVIALSNVTGNGLEALQAALVPGRTYCLLGSSGVGKTTLINRLLGREAFETRAVSGTGEGIHTTTRRQLVVLGQGALLIDTPGMRELGLAGSGEGIEAGFAEIAALAIQCRYADCGHEREPGCAVRAAVERGDLSAARYRNYLKIRKESAYHGMSQLERRRKDRAFGRLVRAVKKGMKD